MTERWATALGEAAGVLARADVVALACHVNPDPDAIGSMLGLAAYLETRGIRTVCSWGNQPLIRPEWLSVLDGAGSVVDPQDFPADPAVMVALDTAAPDRLGMLRTNADRAGHMIVIDHHRTNPGFGSILVLDPAASSTAEMVFRLIDAMGGPLPDVAAGYLYAGVVTDTGRFQYEATTPETLRVAAELRSHAFDHVRLAQSLFDDGSVGGLKATAAALDRVVHVPEASLVWTYLTQSDLARSGVGLPEMDDLIDVIRSAREADVACVIKQQADGRFKVSLRSRGATDVGSVAAAFGGGGHRLASGYTSTTGLEETAQALTESLLGRQDGRSGPADG
jgi:phosphoesterase RecJ-like protein